MKTITALEPGERPYVVTVRVGDRRVASVHATDVIVLGLSVGMPWTDRLEEAVLHACQRLHTRSHAQKLLAHRALSRAELAERLDRWGAEPHVASEILDALESEGVLDDLDYARNLTAELLAHGPAGRELIVERLARRRVAPDLAETVADEALAAAPEDDCVQWARSRLARMSRLHPVVVARRIAGGLARRGVDEDRIRSVLVELDLPCGDD
ncbi:MAG: regulatory protein RecX [Planctomycetota bacterium]|jgi:regulatory protein